MNDLMHHNPFLEMILPPLGEPVVTIRPVQPSDVQPILEMHQRLSSNTLFLRYLVPYLPAQLSKHLHHICHRPAAHESGFVAEQDAQIVGFGYFIIKPDQPDTAEPALLIEDRFQGQGIGGRLFNQLVAAARAQGVRFFNALSHSSNRPMQHLLWSSGRLISSRIKDGEVSSCLSLTTNGCNPESV